MSPLIGISGVAFCIWFFLKYEGSAFTGYFQWAGIVMLGVGPPSIMLLSHSIIDFLTGLKLLGSSMFSRIRKDHVEAIEIISAASKAVRAEGIGAVIPFRNKARYEFLRDGLSLIVNDFKPDEIRNNLMARINLKQGHMQMAASLFQNMSKLCPGVGMIGTLLGLIGMLANMSDPTKIGSNMALAMLTTLYGLCLGTIIYGPWGEKLVLEAEKSLEVDLLIVEGILNIKGKKSSAHLRDLVKSYSKDPSGKKGEVGEEGHRKGAS